MKTVSAGFPGRAVIGAFLLAAQFVFAAATFATQHDDELLTIVITASRLAETADQSMAPVSVITRDDIEQSGATSVAEVLQQKVPGLSLGNNGGAGKLTSLFLRGTESDHILVLIDGVKVGSASSGLYQFEHLSPAQVEKIEVVRGPRSSLYGPEAIGGVIQVFTRKERGVTASVSAGKHGANAGELGFGDGDRNKWYRLNVSGVSTDGFDARNTAASDADDDGYENLTFSLRGGGVLTSRAQWEFGAVKNNSETEYDDGVGDREDRQYHLKLHADVMPNWRSQILLAHAKDESEDVTFGSFGRVSLRDTRRKQASWQNNISFANDGVIILGVDYVTEDHEEDSFSSYDGRARDNTGAFASLHLPFSAIDSEVSVRRDDNQDFGDKTTGSIALACDIDAHSRVVVSWATGFKIPAYNDLSTYPDRWEGNPDLEPELSETIDFGIRGRRDNTAWSLNVFRTEIRDLIDSECVSGCDGNNPISRSINIEKAKISGVELVANMTGNAWRVGGSLVLQSPEYVKNADHGASFGGAAADALNGEQLPRRPKRILQIDFDRFADKWRFGGSFLARGASPDSSYSPDTINDGFNTLDLRVGYAIDKNWGLTLNLNNVFDEKYETASTYNQDGFNAHLTLRYQSN